MFLVLSHNPDLTHMATAAHVCKSQLHHNITDVHDTEGAEQYS